MFFPGFRQTAHWLRAQTVERIRAFCNASESEPFVIEIIQNLNKTSPFGTKIIEIKIKSQSERCGIKKIFLLQSFWAIRLKTKAQISTIRYFIKKIEAERLSKRIARMI